MGNELVTNRDFIKGGTGLGPVGATRLMCDFNGKLVASIDGAVTSAVGSPELYTSLTNATGAQQTLTLGGLNGDVDGDYWITGRMNSAVGANVLSIVLNGAATSLWWLTSNDAVGGVVNASSWTWGQAGVPSISWSANDYVEFDFHMRARSGRTRMIQGQAVTLKAGAQTTFSLKGEFLNAGSNVTSIGIISSQAAGLGVGSYIRAIQWGTSNQLSLAPAGPQVLFSAWTDNTIP